MNWTPLYHGVSHLGEVKADRRAAVTVWRNFTELTKWRRHTDKTEPGTHGYGFLSEQETFRGPKHEELARKAGEKHVKEQ